VRKTQQIVFSLVMFQTVFVYLDDGSGVGRKIQAVCAGLMIPFVLFNIRYFFWKRFRQFNLSILLFSFSVLISSLTIRDLYVGIHYDASSYSLGILYIVILIELTVFIETLIATESVHTTISVFFKLFLFYCIVNDILMFAGVNFVEGYLIGNKFRVAYFHITCAVFYYLKENTNSNTKSEKTSSKGYLLLIYAVFVSFYVQTMTGIIGAFLLLILVRFKDIFFNLLSSPLRMIILLFLFTSLSFFFSVILANNTFLSSLISDLGREDTFSSRLIIYEHLFEMIRLRPLTGYGIENSSSFSRYNYGFDNAQNGIFNVMLGLGAIGVFTLFYMIYVSLKNINKNAYPLVFLIFMFITLSCVETTLGMRFVFLLVFLQIFRSNSNCNVDLKTIQTPKLD